MEENNSLSERKKAILLGSVEAYINSASPITSGKIFDNMDINCSTATLRNELNSLEAMGYLKQLHTSGGRVPTSKSYRYYVDSIMKEAEFTEDNLGIVKEMFREKSEHYNDIIEKLTEKISETINYPTVFSLKTYGNLIVESVKIITLISLKGIVLISTKSGIIDTTIDLKSEIEDKHCVEAANMLTMNYKGQTINKMLEGLRTLQLKLNDFKDVIGCVLVGLNEIVNRTKIIKTGTNKLLNEPEYNSMKNAKTILTFLDDAENVENIFKDGSNEKDDLEIIIGKENEREELKNCSIIKANYNVDGENVASIGVIGPERMDYLKLSSALKYIVAEIKTLNKLSENKED